MIPGAAADNTLDLQSAGNPVSAVLAQHSHPLRARFTPHGCRKSGSISRNAAQYIFYTFSMSKNERAEMRSFIFNCV
jgi:hypothetical protein